MIKFLSSIFLAAASDIQFHNWCDLVGIETLQARLRTTSESVAGRGVFAEGDIKEGDVVIKIPEELVLHGHNGAQSFPDVAKHLEKRKRVYDNKVAKHQKRRWWRRLLSRRKGSEEAENFCFVKPDDLWQAELTAYSMASLEQGNHIWAPWIAQWQRSDPMQTMYENGISWEDEAAIDDCVVQLAKLLPDVPKFKLKAAVHIRLERLDDLRRLYGFSDSDLAAYGILISRAIEIGDGIVGVIPMFDMINHSRVPNLALHFNGKEFGLCARRDISHGEELFNCYSKLEDAKAWDEDAAVWNLVQWGIPEPKDEKVLQDF